MPDNPVRANHKTPHWRVDEECKSEYIFKVQSVDEDRRLVNLRRILQIGFLFRDKVGSGDGVIEEGGGKGKGEEEVCSLVEGVIDGRS